RFPATNNPAADTQSQTRGKTASFSESNYEGENVNKIYRKLLLLRPVFRPCRRPDRWSQADTPQVRQNRQQVAAIVRSRSVAKPSCEGPKDRHIGDAGTAQGAWCRTYRTSKSIRRLTTMTCGHG